jgi:hypothetical protein
VSSVLFAVAVLVLVISLLCIWFYPSVQDFMESNNMWNGIKDFTSEFSANTIASLDDLPDLPEKTALVLIPYTEPTDEELTKVKQFVNDGGALLLMDDFGYGNSVLAYIGLPVRFSHKALLDPLFCYKNQWMPRINDFRPEIKESGIRAVMLNHGTALTNVEESQAIAWSSSSSFLDIDGNESWSQDEPKGPFPVAARFRFGKGTIAVVSDPSIMINSMVGRDDNYRFMEYLTSHNGERKSIVIDLSHLTKAPLDVSKTRLISAREVLSTPYALLGIVALIFVVMSRYMLKRGVSSG